MRRDFRTYHLAAAFYRTASRLRLPRHLKDQLSRAAASIVLNLAEGAGRQTRADQARFFSIAFGSLRECQAILDLALDSPGQQAAAEADAVAAHLFRLLQACQGL